MRNLVELQEEAEVAYSRFVSVTVDPPPVTAPFRAGLGARWLFLSDERRVLEELELEEESDPVHRPFLPYSFVLFPDLTIHRIYNGYWYWGRPTNEEIRADLRSVSEQVRDGWDPEGGDDD